MYIYIYISYSENTKCAEDQFKCASNNCIPKTWECDHDNDCKDGSDEKNPIHGEAYSIQHYVINFVSDLRQVVVFSKYSGSSTDDHEIAEI